MAIKRCNFPAYTDNKIAIFKRFRNTRKTYINNRNTSYRLDWNHWIILYFYTKIRKFRLHSETLKTRNPKVSYFRLTLTPPKFPRTLYLHISYLKQNDPGPSQHFVISHQYILTRYVPIRRIHVYVRLNNERGRLSQGECRLQVNNLITAVAINSYKYSYCDKEYLTSGFATFFYLYRDFF